MKINSDIKLDFDDVLLVPKRSKTASRIEVDVEREFHFYHSNQKWLGVPIMIANMDTTGTFDMAQSMSKFNAITCLHKHYKHTDYVYKLKNHKTYWFSMGIKQDDLNKLDEYIRKTDMIPNLCIDVANGYTDDFVNFCKRVREGLGAEPIILAGNVCTPEMVQELILHGGVDIVKVGIGPGSACTTRLKTGVGYPQLSAIEECSHAAHGLKSGDKRLGLICADGGCRTPSDVVKAFAANADFVMLGGMFAGTEECEGDWEYQWKCRSAGIAGQFWQDFDPKYETEKRKTFLTFYGMSSHKAQAKYGGVKDYRSSEGRTMRIPYKGLASDVMLDTLGGIRSACAYVGANCIKDLPKCAEFIRVNRVHFDRTL
jgi:GMP reductase